MKVILEEYRRVIQDLSVQFPQIDISNLFETLTLAAPNCGSDVGLLNEYECRAFVQCGARWYALNYENSPLIFLS